MRSYIEAFIDEYMERSFIDDEDDEHFSRRAPWTSNKVKVHTQINGSGNEIYTFNIDLDTTTWDDLKKLIVQKMGKHYYVVMPRWRGRFVSGSTTLKAEGVQAGNTIEFYKRPIGKNVPIYG